MRNLDLPGANVVYISDWLSSTEAGLALTALLNEVPWTQHQVRLFGRSLPAPRLSAWIGDPGASYTYSRTRHEPQPWTPVLSQLRQRLCTELGADFNSVLVNRYRDGRDSMGWHADDEAELGAEPLIASVSLGATRRMHFRPRQSGSASTSLDLESGSLLLMSGGTQQHYQHAINKTRTKVAERINLTFRSIVRMAGLADPTQLPMKPMPLVK
jgi:alkylated DNA repair dioxygenase AlkB